MAKRKWPSGADELVNDLNDSHYIGGYETDSIVPGNKQRFIPVIKLKKWSYVETVAELKTHIGKDVGHKVNLLGYHVLGDVGDMTYVLWNPLSTDNSVKSFRPNDIGELEPGRWEFPEMRNINVKWFGVTSIADVDGIKNMFAAYPEALYYFDDIETTFKTGNDPSITDYIFSELGDALQKAGRIRSKYDGTYDARDITISIPNGSHTFEVIKLVDYNHKNVTILGESEASTILNVKYNNTPKTWFTLINSSLGEIINLTLRPYNASLLEEDLPTVIAEPLYDIYFMKFISASVKRFLNATIDGYPTTPGNAKNGVALDFNGVGATAELYGIIMKNLKQPLRIYEMAYVSGSYNNIVIENAYKAVVIHNSYLITRGLSCSGFSDGGNPYAGSLFLDADRSHVNTDSGAIDMFDQKYLGSNSVILDRTSVGTNINSVFYKDTFTANFLTTNNEIIDMGLLTSRNEIIFKDRTLTDSTTYKTISYTGNGSDPQTIPTDNALIGKATIRREDGTKICFATRGQIGKIGGANAIFISTADPTALNVYGQMNLVGVDYEALIEK